MSVLDSDKIEVVGGLLRGENVIEVSILIGIVMVIWLFSLFKLFLQKSRFFTQITAVEKQALNTTFQRHIVWSIVGTILVFIVSSFIVIWLYKDNLDIGNKVVTHLVIIYSIIHIIIIAIYCRLRISTFKQMRKRDILLLFAAPILIMLIFPVLAFGNEGGIGPKILGVLVIVFEIIALIVFNIKIRGFRHMRVTIVGTYGSQCIKKEDVKITDKYTYIKQRVGGRVVSIIRYKDEEIERIEYY